MLQKYNGPYIVKLLESAILQKSKTSREALLLMEYYPGDHLLGRLLARNGSYLPQDTIFRMFGQLCLALKDMHLSRPPIVHRDIKLENVLFGTVRTLDLLVLALPLRVSYIFFGTGRQSTPVRFRLLRRVSHINTQRRGAPRC